MSSIAPQPKPGNSAGIPDCVIRTTPWRNFLGAAWLAVLGSFLPICSTTSLADQGIELVAGFDSARVNTAWEDLQNGTTDEIAKLLFRLKKIRPETWDQRSSPWKQIANQNDPSSSNKPVSSDEPVGQLVKLQGEISSRRNLKLAPTMSDLLGIQSLSVLEIRLSDDLREPSSVQVVCQGLPRDASPGDQVSLNGMVIDSSLKSIASPTVSWHPAKAKSISWQWLSDRGLDIGLLPALANRDRRDLSVHDGDAFYGLLQITSPTQWDQLPPSTSVQAIDLLSRPKSNVGELVSIELDSIQITRISIDDPRRATQLGTDHYFQIDAVAELDKVVIKIETDSKESENEPQATFENRYPVSVVATTLPTFLADQMREQSGPQAIASDVAMRIRVEGFFFRLWRYSSEYMKRFGDAKQFGPLIIAARIENEEPSSDDPAGVKWIGWIAAGATITMVGLILVWSWTTSRNDRLLKKRRQENQPSVLSPPAE